MKAYKMQNTKYQDPNESQIPNVKSQFLKRRIHE